MFNRIVRDCNLTVINCFSAAALAFGIANVASADGFDKAAVQVKPLLKTQATWAGQPFRFPADASEVQAMEITLAPGGETGWHTHPVASFAYVLEGELEINLEDGRQHRATSGEAVAEVMGLKHNGRNVGSGPVRLVVFYISEPDITLTEKAEAPK